jgi:response regulator NasT
MSGTKPSSAANPEETGSAAPARILLVDDDRLVLATLSDGLRAAGYEVATASCGGDALQLCRSQPIDLAILDVRMPEMDGIELARRMRAETTVPFLFLSAYGDLDLVHRAADHGALGYLLKPIDIPQMVPSIEAALVRAREIAELRKSEERLTTALSIEQRTRMAVGLLMERERLDRRAAFEVLRSRARSQRRKIAEVADEILSAAETLNGSPPPRGSEHA